MGKVAVLTDTNSGIMPEQAEEMGVYTIPMPFYIDGRLYLEGKNITHEEFYRFQEMDAQISTSMPSPGDVAACWSDLLKSHDTVVYIPMSSGLSSSCQTAVAMAEEAFSGRVFVVDNQRISVPQWQSVREAKALADAGMDGAAIYRRLMETKMDADIYIAVDTLKYLRRGGRVTPAAAALGTVLNIKPVLRIKGEKLDAYAKVRGRAAARETALQALKQAVETDERLHTLDVEGRLLFGVAYTAPREEAEILAREVRAVFPGRPFHMDPLALSIACHIGPGALGVGCCIDLTGEAAGRN